VTRLQEVGAKLEKVRAFLQQQQLSAVVLNTRANFAWLTAGGDNHVVMGSELGVAPLVITNTGQHLLTNNIEAARFEEEELAGLPFEIHFMQWNEEERLGMLASIASGSLGTDAAWPADAIPVADAFARLRWQMLEPEIERYRQVGALASEALLNTGREIEPGQSEHEIAALLAGKVLAAGAAPVVVLIAVDDRIDRYRHPIPTDRRLESRAMLVVGAVKWGLGISATRMVHFAEPSEELAQRHRACCSVDACLNLETRPGASVADIFRRAVTVYRESGFADEWRLHHQGGATGYAPREYKGGFDSEEVVLEDQAFAWNPSITGTKSEDTILARAEGPEFLSSAAGWPTLEVSYEGMTLQRPGFLIR